MGDFGVSGSAISELADKEHSLVGHVTLHNYSQGLRTNIYWKTTKQMILSTYFNQEGEIVDLMFTFFVL